MTDELVENGWFVNDDGDIFAVMNGSAYRVSPDKDSPLKRLAPGSYTDEEVAAFIQPKWLSDMLTAIRKKT